MKHFFLYYAIPTVLCFSSTRKGYIFPFFTLFLISAISCPCLAYDKQYPDFEVEKGSYRTLASLSDVYEYQGGYLGDTYLLLQSLSFQTGVKSSMSILIMRVVRFIRVNAQEVT